MRSICLSGFLALMMGCGSQRPEADIERGRLAVSAALDAWKLKQPASKLKSLPAPVDFVEEMRATHTLMEYSLGPIDARDQDVIRYSVTLKLTDKKGKKLDREVVYAVLLKNPVVVSRDPYY